MTGASIEIPLSRLQKQALKACARARGESCHSIIASALASVLAPYVAEIQADARSSVARAKSDLETDPVPTDAESDFLDDQLLRRLAGLPEAPD
jgi:hypothetical protein